MKNIHHDPPGLLPESGLSSGHSPSRSTQAFLAATIRKKLFLTGKALLFIFIILAKIDPARCQDHLDGINKVIKTGYDQYGAYIDFAFTYWNDNNYNSWLDGGDLYCLPEKGNEFRVAHLETTYKPDCGGGGAGDQDSYPVKIASYAGTIVAKTWEGSDKPEENEYPAYLAPGSNGWNIISSRTDKILDGARVDNNSRVYIRWYVPIGYAGQRLTFRYHWKANIDCDNSRDEDYQGFGIVPYTTITPLTAPALSWDFSNTAPGKFALRYTYSEANPYNTILSFDGQNQQVDAGETPSGVFNITMPVSAHRLFLPFTAASDLTVIQGYEKIADYTQTQNVLIPAYAWPDTLLAGYDDKDTAVLTWHINSLPYDDIITGDNFEVQRSTDSTFRENVKAAGTIPYDNNQTDYTLKDDLSDLKGGSQVYYRLRRTKSGSQWGWGVARKTAMAVTLNAVRDTTGDTAVLNESNGPKAHISFDPFRGVWLNGTKFSIKKNNITTNETAVINLTEDQARSGLYVDENISYCKEYRYSIQLTLGNGYSSPPENDVRGSILAVSIGSISGLTSSKGYFPDRVELRWRSDGGFDNYIVKRKEYGSSDSYIQVASVPATVSPEVDAGDSKAAPGIYYEYIVMGAVSCNNAVRHSDTLHAVGFRSPTGNIYGKVTYENGQGVEDAIVRLENEENTGLGQSVYLAGDTAGYLRLDSLHAPLSDSAFTIEAWIKPDEAAPGDQVIFSRQGQPAGPAGGYELGFDHDGRIYFDYNGQRVTGTYKNENRIFVHVTGIHDHDSLRIMLNDSVVAEAAVPAPVSHTGNAGVYIGRNAAGNYFKGYLDEMRIWNKALSPGEVARNYTRLLAGDEPKLAAYWRFDETIADQFYDLSHEGEHYHQNDGVMSPAGVKRSNTIPTPGQLALKAYTDSTGNYGITGIPYTGSNGATYSIVPLLGTHRFNPADVKRLISAGTPSYTVDFTDVSSFPVSGFVYYRHSRVPVPGVQFQIDGKYAQESNGTLIQTGADGKFTISVPVGTHEVKAVKNNHVFVNAGRITDSRGNNLNYQGPVNERILYDSTTVRFIGRLAGGAVQEAFPLGHSLSTNNLGKELRITLELPNQSDQWLVADEDGDQGGDSLAVVAHLLPADRAGDSAYIHKTKVQWQSEPGINRIVIYPDSLTGEFEADLIPVKFTVSAAEATGWGNVLEGGNAVSVDLTNQFFRDSSVYNYEDSSQTDDGNRIYTHYSDTVYYNEAYKFIKRVTPNVSIVQLDGGREMGFFGDSLYQFQSMVGENTTIPLIDDSKSGSAKYLFGGHPIFSQNVLYRFKIEAFEEYPFYESVKQDGAPVVAQRDGKDLVDQVPTQDGSVSLYNRVQNGPSPDTVSLDSAGLAFYHFIAGDPETTAPGLKGFSATVRFGGATDVSWKWLGDAGGMKAFVTGSKQAGTDFVTAGPNRLLMVLRDPPGNRSYSFAERGSTVTSSTAYSGTVDNETDLKVLASMGQQIKTFAGIGVGYISEIDNDNELGVGVHFEAHYTHNDTRVSTTTLTTRFRTSDAPLYVGAPADLFVGYSTNITYGQSSNLVIIDRNDVQAGDSVILDPGSNYLAVIRPGISLGEKFGTLFAYPQQHIETVLIPNLEKIRNTLLLPPSTDPAAAQQTADSGKTEVYVSRLAPGDGNFGKSNNDVSAFGDAARSMPFDDGPSYKIYFPRLSDYHTDSILAINQYISGWEDAMRDNEKAKLESRLLQNYSFHAGNPINYSETTSFSKTKTDEFHFIISGSAILNTGIRVNGIGMKVQANTTLGTKEGGSLEKTTDTVSTIGFELAADGVGEYISIDVNKADDGGLAFRTKGGETECPYEGIDTTKYYNPGTVIGLPTAQMDKPRITVDNPVMNNVPATKSAAYTLHLTNASEAAWSTDFVLSYGSTDSVRGATISVDGVSIATGRSYPVIYGEPLTKVLTLSKGPDAMDYNNIPIILHSACQYDPTGYQQPIADTVLISAHFVPSCSNVNIKSPADNWVLNALSPTDQRGARYLPVTLDQFDESNSLFDHLELQYKPSANSQWVTAMNFYADSAIYQAAEGEKSLITNAMEINYNLEMDDASFNDQRYDVRALAVCRLGPGNFINTPSGVVSGIKDTYTPRLFGSPEPANGILGATDEIRLNFNESLAGGLLAHNDFQVTGIRNGARGDHSVSVSLDGENDYLETEFSKNLTGRDITAEMWILPGKQGHATLFSHGNINESLELAVTEDNRLQVTVGKKKISSDGPVDYKPGEWAHVALVYRAADSTVFAFYNFKEVIHGITAGGYEGIGLFDFGRSISGKNNYFGGKMHEVRIWTQALSATALQVNSLTQLSGAEGGLLACYPMTEGKGNIVYDKAHANNAVLTGTWSTPPGKAMALNGDGYIQVPAGTAPVTPGMDYTLELWFKAGAGQSNAALVSNGKGDGTDPGGSKNLFFLGFENGLLTFENNGDKIQAEGNYLDNQWHQLALAVNRLSGIAQWYVDGQLKKYFEAKNLGGIESPAIYLGARGAYDDTDLANPGFDRYFTGSIDEFRLWNTYLDRELITDKSNVRLNGDELGLMLYYPFERYIEFQHNKELDSTTRDMRTGTANPVTQFAKIVRAVMTDDMAPIKDRGPVDNLQFDYVVNNDALIINLLEPKQAVDKTIVTFRVSNARDINGNPLLSPVTWTAYIDQNPLKWGDDAFTLVKGADTSMQFTSYIINRGGSVQHFTLDNLPAWLTASITDGTVDPAGKQPVTFEVNSGLNIGAYDEIIYMRNDNGETESLPINLTVKGKAPDWKADPAGFKYNMTVYGKIRLNGIFSDNPDDMLAVFRNGKCTGVVHNAYFRDNGLWYAFLTIYSDSVQDDHLEFRIWNASNGKIYEGRPSVPITFANDAIIGTPGNPVIFDGQELLFQNITLEKGWNWISYNLAGPGLSDVSTTLSNGSWMSGDMVKNNELGFDQYSVSSGWVGYLDGFNNTSLFMLKAAIAQTLSVGGTIVDVTQTAIPLKGGRWNYISYLPQNNMTVKEALAGYEASDEDVIKSQTGFAMYDSHSGWIGNLAYLEPGKGYMLYRKSGTDTAFHYPFIPGILRRAPGAAPDGRRLNPYQAPVEGNYRYADNMTVTAVAGKEFALQPNDRVLAYAGDELRGEATAISNPAANSHAFFINISGKEVQPVYFKIKRDGVVMAQSEPLLPYTPGAIVGTVTKPFVIHFNSTITKIAVLPNPFRNGVTIRMNFKENTATSAHKVQISVYDASGNRIYTRSPVNITGGYYQTAWNGMNDNGTPAGPGIYFIHIIADGKPFTYKVVKI